MSGLWDDVAAFLASIDPSPPAPTKDGGDQGSSPVAIEEDSPSVLRPD